MEVHEASRHGTRCHLSLHRQPEVSHEVVEETLLILQDWSRPYQGGCSQFLISSEVLIRASAIGNINSPSLGNYASVVLLQSSVDEQRWADSMALMHNNSMVVLHKICEIPRICLYERLSVLLMARETSFNSLPSFRNFGCARM